MLNPNLTSIHVIQSDGAFEDGGPCCAGGTQARTRAVHANDKGKAEWNEQLVLDLAAPSGKIALR